MSRYMKRLLHSKFNFNTFLLYFIIVINTNCFFLVSQYKSIWGPISFQEIVVICNVLCALYTQFRYSNKIDTASKKVLFSILLMYVCSCLCASVNFDVSFISTLFSLRLVISQYLLLPFFMHNNIYTLRNAVFGTGVIYLSIAILQYIVSDYILFTYVTANVRYGEIRLYFPSSIILLLLMISFQKIFEKNNKKLLYCFVVISCFIFFVIVTKGRMISIAVIVSFVVLILLRKRYLGKKLVILSVTLIGLAYFLSTNMGQDLMSLFTVGQSTSDNSSWLREYGRKYYLEKLSIDNGISSVFGYGFPPVGNTYGYNFTHPVFRNAIVYPEDNGIVGYSIYFGLFSIMLWIAFLVYSLYLSTKILLNTGDSSFFIVPFVDIIPSISLVPMFLSEPIFFVIYYTYLRKEYLKEVL